MEVWWYTGLEFVRGVLESGGGVRTVTLVGDEVANDWGT